MNLISRIVLVLMLMSLISCGGSGGGSGDDDANAECSQNGKNEFVYELLTDTYLWYDQVGLNIDPTLFPSPETLLESVRPPIDKWSYIQTAEDFYEYYEEGRYPGMGLAVAFDQNQRLWVRFVYEGSPADLAGLKRSDEIIYINNRPASSLADLNAIWDEVYRLETASIQTRSLGVLKNVTLEWRWVTINTVLHREVIEVGDRQVGYLVFKTFIETAEAELDDAFAYFKQQHIDDLVLDLRYNGGGRGSITQHLASLIMGEDATGEVFRKKIHNDKYSQYDDAMLFTAPTHALGLDRLFVISTDDTCSASELIINGLRPYIEVIQVGGTTCGKPVGMYAHDFCDLVMVPVEFKSANALDETDYFGGLVPTCPALDDLSHQFGDPEEDSLKTAIYYIANESCPAPTNTTRAMLAQEPQPMNDLSGWRRELGAF